MDTEKEACMRTETVYCNWCQTNFGECEKKVHLDGTVFHDSEAKPCIAAYRRNRGKPLFPTMMTAMQAVHQHADDEPMVKP